MAVTVDRDVSNISGGFGNLGVVYACLCFARERFIIKERNRNCGH